MNFEGTSNQDADNRYNASPQLCIKSIKTEDPNQILEINKKKIEKEIDKARTLLQGEQIEIEPLWSIKSQFNNNQDFDRRDLYPAQEDRQPNNYYYITMCQQIFKEEKYKQYLDCFEQFFKNEYLDEQLDKDVFNFAIVVKLNFEKMPVIQNHNERDQIRIVLNLFDLLNDRIKKELNHVEYQNQDNLKVELDQVVKKEFQNSIGKRQTKTMGQDFGLIIVSISKSREYLDELLNKCYAIKEQNKKVFEDETQKVVFYERKLKKVCEKKFIMKFEIQNFKNNKYNFICQHLLKQHFLKEKEQNEQLKYEGKSYPIIFSCFIQYTLNWINLLDFKQKDNKKILDSIKEVIKQSNIEKLITNETFEYFDKNPYKKYDFIEFMIKLIIVFKQIQGKINTQQEQLSQDFIQLKERQLQYQVNWYNDLNDQQSLSEYYLKMQIEQSQVSVDRLEIQQKELLNQMENISEIKKNRYQQKKNINFSRQTLIKLIKSDAKPELDIAIQTFLDNPNQILSQMKLNENECNLVRKEMEKIQIKLLK